MDVILIVMQVILLIGVGALVIHGQRMKKQLSKMKEYQELKAEMKKDLQEEGKQIATRLQQEIQYRFQMLTDEQKTEMSERQSAANQELQRIGGRVTEETERRIEEKTQQLLDRFNVYIEEEEREINAWLTHVQQEDNRAKKVDILESAINKHPSSRKLVEGYIAAIQPLTQATNDRIRKSAIERMQRTLRVFLDHCQAEDFTYAFDQLDASLKLGNNYMNEVEGKRADHLNATLKKLESYMNKLDKNGSLSEADIEEIEKLDSALDRSFLAQDEAQKKRYEVISKKLMDYFTNQAPSEQEKRSYNFKALQAIKQAHESFLSHEKEAKKGTNIQKYSRLLGGWDMDRFYPATQVYYQSVYSDIFSKLEAQVKPEFTKMIMNSDQQTVG
ncbi:hypothetical protein [Texcoconibacillus texcoconensis]|uniref:Skp family chaperone for outer membrane proteins n=1 Tax=Texcoconibacillus texcoconensis TaxID=1095777 RepID=A0A840QU06_9BACI|nr:hypothetical protein [Texcoconibacillus texcoconensis]MBB5175036.1 Skp family chaperone for outer membrane proteins [Texcoconibacillus texcoconensis]